MYNCTEKYSKIRGFNFQPDWAANGKDIWLSFDAKRYETLIKNGKEKFPTLNCLRIWLSFEAFITDRRKYLKNLSIAGRILTKNKLKIIPVYFNGWFSMPNFGGFSIEQIDRPDTRHIYEAYQSESVNALSNSDLLLHDISNEPYNNSLGSKHAVDSITEFLGQMANTIKKTDSRPITVGTQGYLDSRCTENERENDFVLLKDIVDVYSLHPYNILNLSKQDFETNLTDILEYADTFGKPVIISECCWGTKNAKSRKPYLDTELNAYKKFNLGFCCHALSTSPVADLHPLTGKYQPSNGLYMAFLDKNGNIRPYHDIFNNI